MISTNPNEDGEDPEADRNQLTHVHEAGIRPAQPRE